MRSDFWDLVGINFAAATIMLRAKVRQMELSKNFIMKVGMHLSGSPQAFSEEEEDLVFVVSQILNQRYVSLKLAQIQQRRSNDQSQAR